MLLMCFENATTVQMLVTTSGMHKRAAYRTFKHLTKADSGICKHDAKGNGHDTDQRPKHSFQVAHPQPVYQQ